MLPAELKVRLEVEEPPAPEAPKLMSPLVVFNAMDVDVMTEPVRSISLLLVTLRVPVTFAEF